MVTVTQTDCVELGGSSCRWLLRGVCLSIRPPALSCSVPCFTTSGLTLGVTCTICLLFVEDGRFNGVEVSALIWNSAGISEAGKSPADRTPASPERSEPRAASAGPLL